MKVLYPAKKLVAERGRESYLQKNFVNSSKTVRGKCQVHHRPESVARSPLQEDPIGQLLHHLIDEVLLVEIALTDDFVSSVKPCTPPNNLKHEFNTKKLRHVLKKLFAATRPMALRVCIAV
jgi:hypothetical protein